MGNCVKHFILNLLHVVLSRLTMNWLELLGLLDAFFCFLLHLFRKNVSRLDSSSNVSGRLVQHAESAKLNIQNYFKANVRNCGSDQTYNITKNTRVSPTLVVGWGSTDTPGMMLTLEPWSAALLIEPFGCEICLDVPAEIG